MKSAMERYFEFAPRGARWRDELAGGVTAFLTMAYIIFLQPALLVQAGMDFGAVLAATCISAALATVIMGVWANYPIALAPGMGENFFFVFGVVIATGMAWQEALSAVFYAGVIFVVLSFGPIRRAVLDAIPDVLKAATGVGVGIFIAFIGFADAGIVKNNPGGLVQLGDLSHPATLLALAGLTVTGILMVRRVPAAVFWGLLLTAIGGMIAGFVKLDGIVAAPPSLAPTLGKLDWTPTLDSAFLSALFVFLFMAVFDATGTLAALGKRAGYFVNGKLPRASRAFAADALGGVGGAVLGTSTVTAYIESASGIMAGAKTGVAALVTAALFLMSLFFAPLVKAVAGGVPIAGGGILRPITAPALIVVGALMVQMAREIPWDDLTEALPAFLIAIGIPLTFSISDGLTFGFVSYPIVKVAAGRRADVHPAMYAVAALFILRYVVA
ncbi:MAG: NCS2 family permease [Candidatus Zixiibacteriota bacterium]